MKKIDILTIKYWNKIEIMNEQDVISYEDGRWPDKNLPAAHFAIHRNWFNTVGYLAPPFFWHWHVDSYTQKVARKINRCLYLPTVEFKAKKVFDDTGKQVRTNMNINNRDNFVWQKVRNRHLEADVKVLKDFIKDQQTQ